MRIIGLLTPGNETGIDRNGIAYFESGELGEGVFVVFWDRASVVSLIEADEETDPEEREAYLACLAASEMPESTPEWPPIVITGWPAEVFIELCHKDEDGEGDQEHLVFPKTRAGFIYACLQSGDEGEEEAFFFVWMDEQHIVHLHHFYQRSTLSRFLRLNPLFDRNVEQICMRVSEGLPQCSETPDLELVGFAAMLLYLAMIKEAENDEEEEADDDTEEEGDDEDSKELPN